MALELRKLGFHTVKSLLSPLPIVRVGWNSDVVHPMPRLEGSATLDQGITSTWAHSDIEERLPKS